jgi:hypothetical protein
MTPTVMYHRLPNPGPSNLRAGAMASNPDMSLEWF